MTDVDFNAILDTKVEEIKAKPPLPVGSYLARIAKLENTKSSKKGTDGVEFTLVPMEAKEDVDAELLEAAGGLKDRTIRHTLWVTPESANMLKEFLTLHVGLEGSGRTLRQLLADAVNQTVGIHIIHKPATDGSDRQFAQVDKAFKLA